MGYCTRLKKKMHIRIGRSTFAFCLADPLGVLEEGEVHFGFSTTFRDPGSTFEDTMLHGIDVLVARLPAALPSDVQKVFHY
jgi:RNA dependent RNA polymerase